LRITDIFSAVRRDTTYKITTYEECIEMAKPHRQLKKANHGKRPANAKARKAKRRMIKT
jgi:hypothetical protein